MLSHYLTLTKTGIISFVLLCVLVGYGMSFPVGQSLDIQVPFLLLIGVYLLSAGSFALNQSQEWRADQKMPRTQGRPIPNGKMALWQGYALGFLYIIVGLALLYLLSSLSFWIGLLTVLLYNGFYTYWWKPHSAFAAVPGALPGALPVVLGYAVNTQHIWNLQILYLFLLLFLWQMPHFWAIAIRYQEDYKLGQFPVLPAVVGVHRTLFHIGLYMLVYVGVALAAPFFVRMDILYVLVFIPLSLKLLWESWKYIKSNGEKHWLSFFLWTTLSILFFLTAPVLERWLFVFLRS